MRQAGRWMAGLGVVLSALLVACPCAAQSAREILTQASFSDDDEASSLRRVAAAYAAAGNMLHRSPDDREALLMRATALGYRAKLTGNRGDAVAARREFEALIAEHPLDAEAQLGLGAWHIGAVKKLGAFVGRAALGAQRSAGFAALDRAVALGGDRAMFPGLVALLRLQLDPRDPRGKTLAEAAVRAAAPTPIDRIVQRAAVTVLASIRAGDMQATRRLASQLLPFGRFDRDN